MEENKRNGIWVFVEINNDVIHNSTFELLSKARELAEKSNQEVSAILLGNNNDDYHDLLIGHGAHQVIDVSNDLLENYNPVVYKDAIVSIVQKYKPSIFLFAATQLGRSLAPRVQGALQTGLTADCLDLDINDKGELIQIKPSFGDNLMCTIFASRFPQMSTIRPSVFKALEYNKEYRGKVIKEEVNIVSNNYFEVIEINKLDENTDSIKDVKRIVAIGRGIKNKDDLSIVEEFAQVLNASVGVSRPLAEKGWYTLDRQIGQSGQTVSPDFIINLGISGALQYTAGVKNSKFVFSVNSDESAAIFKDSDYGYVGDAISFMKELIRTLK